MDHHQLVSTWQVLNAVHHWDVFSRNFQKMTKSCKGITFLADLSSTSAKLHDNHIMVEMQNSRMTGIQPFHTELNLQVPSNGILFFTKIPHFSKTERSYSRFDTKLVFWERVPNCEKKTVKSAIRSSHTSLSNMVCKCGPDSTEIHKLHILDTSCSSKVEQDTAKTENL